MVGVPCFERCLSGTSSSIISTACFFFNIPMIHGPSRKENNNAVMKAATDRNVIYLNTLKKMLLEARGANKL
jgi:hypothetical protein